MSEGGNKNNIDARLSELQVGLKLLGEDLNKVAHTTNESITRLAELIRIQGEKHQNDISEIWAERRQSLKPNWGWLIAGAGLWFTTFTFLLGSVWLVADDYLKHVRDGHPEAVINMLKEKTKDRYTQAQGVGLENRIERLEQSWLQYFKHKQNK